MQHCSSCNNLCVFLFVVNAACGIFFPQADHNGPSCRLVASSNHGYETCGSRSITLCSHSQNGAAQKHKVCATRRLLLARAKRFGILLLFINTYARTVNQRNTNSADLHRVRNFRRKKIVRPETNLQVEQYVAESDEQDVSETKIKWGRF